MTDSDNGNMFARALARLLRQKISALFRTLVLANYTYSCTAADISPAAAHVFMYICTCVCRCPLHTASAHSPLSTTCPSL